MLTRNAYIVENYLRANPDRLVCAGFLRVKLRINEKRARWQLHRLWELGLVTRDDTARPHLYRWK